MDLDRHGKSWDVVVLGGINTDFLVRSEHLPSAGQTVQGRSFYTGPGGKGANQAVAAARLGARVALIGRVGDEPRGHELVRGLLKNGVNIDHVAFDSREPSGAAIIAVDAKGEKQISAASGANARVSVAQVDAAEDLIAGARVLLTQLELPNAAVLRAAALACKHHTKVILDPAPPRPIPAKLFRLLHVIRPNRDEAERITGRRVRSAKDAKAAAKDLIRRGVRVVAMEAGGKGDLVISSEEEIRIPRLKIRVIDATGAGDAFAGGFAVGLAEGLSLREIARLAHATAALSTTRVGAQEALPTRQQVERLLRRG